MSSLAFIVITVGVWLKVSIISNTEESSQIQFLSTQSDTYALYCQATHQKDNLFSPDINNNDIPTFFLPAELEYWSKKTCVEMHILGNQSIPDKKIIPYVLASCTAKYIPLDDIDDLEQLSIELANNLTSLKDFATFSLDNSNGRVTCTGDDRYFDLFGSDFSFHGGDDQKFAAINILRGKSNGKVTLQAQLTWSDAPLFTLKKVSCTLCLRMKNNGSVNYLRFRFLTSSGLLLVVISVLYAFIARSAILIK